MAIGNAVQRSSFVYVYDEKGRQLCTLSAGGGQQDGLKLSYPLIFSKAKMQLVIGALPR